MQFIRRLRKSILTVSVLSIVVVYVSGLLLFNFYYRQIVKRNIAYDNKLFAASIDNCVSNELERLIKLANLDVTHEALLVAGDDLETPYATLQTYLDVEVSSSKVLDGLFVFDKNRNLVAFRNNDLSSLYPLDISTIFFDDEKPLSHRQKICGNDNQYLCLFEPVIDNSKFVGSIVSTIGLKKMPHFNQREFMFNSTQRLVFDNESSLIHSTIKEKEQIDAAVEIFNKRIIGENENGFISFKLAGSNRLGNFCYNRELGWIIVTMVSAKEYYNLFFDSVVLFILIVILIIALLIVAIKITDKKIGKPVQQLLDGMQQAQLLNYNYEIKGSDFGDFFPLVDIFNKMMKNISSYTEGITAAKKELDSLTTNIPGGLFICSIDEGFPFKLVSEPYALLAGYRDKEELLRATKSLFINTVESSDRQIVKDKLKKRREGIIDYRSANSSDRILSCSFRITDDLYFGNKLILCAMVIDITEKQLAFERLSRGEKRYQIILDQTDEVIFEWSIEEKKLLYSSNQKNWLAMFGYTVDEKCNDFFVSQLKMGKDDQIRFDSFLTDIMQKKKKQGRIDVRLTRIDENQYESLFWARIMVCPLVNKEGEINRLIGRIVDINEQKKESIELRELSVKDHLTNLLNRRSFTQSVINLLESSDPTINSHILLMIDIDDFKKINDTYGHIFGDTILVDVADTLKNSFRVTDFFGRVGGDEFAVVLINFNDKAVLKQKIQILLDKFRQKGISCSIGVACYPEDGTDFDELYINGDKALYSIKNGPKNSFTFYKNHNS